MKFTRRFPFISRDAAMSAARRASPDETDVLFFDGVKFTPINSKKPGLFTGYGNNLHLPSGKLRDDDIGRAMAYLACEYAFNGIRMVASDIAGIPFGVRVIDSQQDLPDHPLIQAINWARRLYQQEVISLWQIDRYVFGEVYALPETNVFGLYNCLRLLNPLAIEKWIPFNTLDGFQYSANGDYHRFETNEVAFDKVANPLDDINGLAPLSVALDAVNIDKEIKRYTLDNFLKNMRMAGILTGRAGSQVNDQDLGAVVRRLKEQKGERLVAIAPQLEFKQVQQSVDGSQLSLSEDARRRIAAALGIPLSVLGAWDSSTFQSAPEQRRHYYESIIFRECFRHALFMTERVLPYFDDSGKTECYYDTDSVSALVEDKAAKTTMVNSRQAAGNLTINEARVALGDKPVLGGDVFILNGQVVTLEQLAAMATRPAAPLVPDAAPALSQPTPAQPEKAVEPTAQAGMKDAWLGLTLPNHPDLIPLQNRVKQLIGEGQCEWNDPADFHVTLLHIPAIGEDEAAALLAAMDDVDVPQMALRVGSLGVFDDVGQHAVHFKIRQNADLKDLQETLYDICEGLGLRMRSFFQPSLYNPHITMGYAAQPLKRVVYTGKTAVQPSEMHLSIGGEVVYRKACGKPTVKSEPPPEPQTIHEAALDELAAWQKKTKNKGAIKALDFKPYLIRDEVAQGIRLALAEAGDDREALKTIFENARAIISYKAVAATRINFEDGFEDILNDALAGNLTRRRWSSLTRNLIAVSINKAYRDGLADGGVDDEPDENEQATIDAMIADQSVYVTNLGNTLYKTEDTISEEMAGQKPALWWNGSIAPAYSAGLLSADANSMFMWQLGQTEKHCLAEGSKWGCATLDGTSKRYKTWKKLNLIAGTVGQDTTCGGWRCDCHLIRKAGKSSAGEIELQIEMTHTH